MTDKPRILVVDDEPDIVLVISKRLEMAGFDVFSAADGQEGLDKARSEKPDLVVLDLMLPKMNGYQVCTLLKRDTEYEKIPILMLTAKGEEADKQMGMQCGANVYMTKPYQFEMLLSMIQTLLGKSDDSDE